MGTKLYLEYVNYYPNKRKEYVTRKTELPDELKVKRIYGSGNKMVIELDQLKKFETTKKRNKDHVYYEDVFLF